MPVRKQGGECQYLLEGMEKSIWETYIVQPKSRNCNAEAHRALELLEDYHAKLTRPQDKQLRLAIERVIRIFKSRLFQALLAPTI
ncbi:disks large 1 tumor suppressor protein-like isoform X2 [Belonocnema kinseyi]|uniref:disks large 1 tumor suppressor protein-like isoform X2 n=1 Tax=Belonocnema kinseyi TaxID=2817044 RepID=UPI00143D477E|nr:disks large 1 tumor suppressor protein-like isoform X2 [Belonocnema kinseyi]